MSRIYLWTTLAMLAVGGCQSNSPSGARLPGDTGAPNTSDHTSDHTSDNAADTNGSRPSERPNRMNGTGDNGDQLPLNGLH